MEEFFDPCGIAESQPSLKPQAYDFGLGLDRVGTYLMSFIFQAFISSSTLFALIDIFNCTK